MLPCSRSDVRWSMDLRLVCCTLCSLEVCLGHFDKKDFLTVVAHDMKRLRVLNGSSNSLTISAAFASNDSPHCLHLPVRC